MAYSDAGVGQGSLSITVAAIDNAFSSALSSIDLNPDFGSGPSGAAAANLRRSPYPGQDGEDCYLRVEFAVLPTAVGTNPLMQFHAFLSDTPAAGGPPITANVAIIGSNVGPLNDLTNALYVPGWIVGDLSLTSVLYIRLNPWVELMGRAVAALGAGAAILAKDLRYLSLAIVCPNYVASTTHLSGGFVTATLVAQSDIGRDASDFVYPAGHINV